MGAAFHDALRDLAAAFDAVDGGDLGPPAPPPDPVRTVTGDQVEVTMLDGRVTGVLIAQDLLSYADDEDLWAAVADGLNAALAEHEDALGAVYLEAGGQPNPVALLWQAQSYASSELMMELEDAHGQR